MAQAFWRKRDCALQGVPQLRGESTPQGGLRGGILCATFFWPLCVMTSTTQLISGREDTIDLPQLPRSKIRIVSQVMGDFPASGHSWCCVLEAAEVDFNSHLHFLSSFYRSCSEMHTSASPSCKKFMWETLSFTSPSVFLCTSLIFVPQSFHKIPLVCWVGG